MKSIPGTAGDGIQQPEAPRRAGPRHHVGLLLLRFARSARSAASREAVACLHLDSLYLAAGARAWPAIAGLGSDGATSGFERASAVSSCTSRNRSGDFAVALHDPDSVTSVEPVLRGDHRAPPSRCSAPSRAPQLEYRPRARRPLGRRYPMSWVFRPEFFTCCEEGGCALRWVDAYRRGC